MFLMPHLAWCSVREYLPSLSFSTWSFVISDGFSRVGEFPAVCCVQCAVYSVPTMEIQKRGAWDQSHSTPESHTSLFTSSLPHFIHHLYLYISQVVCPHSNVFIPNTGLLFLFSFISQIYFVIPFAFPLPPLLPV